jgi:hypothetical protein
MCSALTVLGILLLLLCVPASTALNALLQFYVLYFIHFLRMNGRVVHINVCFNLSEKWLIPIEH